MDETARGDRKRGRMDPAVGVFRMDEPGSDRKVLAAGNRRLFLDWLVPELSCDGIARISSMSWFSPRHRRLLDFGGFSVSVRFLGEELPPWRVYTWYGEGMLPASCVILRRQGGLSLNLRAYALMLPLGDEWTLALQVENLTDRVLPPVTFILRGTLRVGMEKGSVFDPVNPIASPETLLRGTISVEKEPRRVRLENRGSRTFLDLLVNHSITDFTHSVRNIAAPGRQDGPDPGRQEMEFTLSTDVPLKKGICRWGLFRWRFADTLPRASAAAEPSGALLKEKAGSAWRRQLACTRTIETPFPALTEGLKRSVAYTRCCFLRAGKDGVQTVCHHGAFPLDCPRDTFAMTCLMQYLEPELSRRHMESYFLRFIPRQGLGRSYVENPAVLARHRLLDLACYPLLGLCRYWRMTGGRGIEENPMREALASALRQLFRFEDDSVEGLVTATHRSSDERCVLPVFVPGDMMLAVTLENIADLLEGLYGDRALARSCRAWAGRIRQALRRVALVRDPEFGQMWAFETDGKGNFLLYDQADYPNLLTIPYFGFCPKDDPVYISTRRFIFSPRNVGYAFTADSRYATLCDGSKQDPERPWALGIMGELMADPTPAQARRTFDWLEHALTPGYFLTETVDKYSGQARGGPFGWATALMAVLFIEVVCGFRPGRSRAVPCVPDGWERFRSPEVLVRNHRCVLRWEKGNAVLTVDGKRRPALDIPGTS